MLSPSSVEEGGEDGGGEKVPSDDVIRKNVISLGTRQERNNRASPYVVPPAPVTKDMHFVTHWGPQA